MNRVRFGLAFTMLLGSTYAGFGLLISLRDFGIGLAIAAAAMVAYELTIVIDDHRRGDDWLKEYRELVWERRDTEAGQHFWIDK